MGWVTQPMIHWLNPQRNICFPTEYRISFYSVAVCYRSMHFPLTDTYVSVPNWKYIEVPLREAVNELHELWQRAAPSICSLLEPNGGAVHAAAKVQPLCKGRTTETQLFCTCAPLTRRLGMSAHACSRTAPSQAACSACKHAITLRALRPGVPDVRLRVPVRGRAGGRDARAAHERVPRPRGAVLLGAQGAAAGALLLLVFTYSHVVLFVEKLCMMSNTNI